jgi:hypothetical protein
LTNISLNTILDGKAVSKLSQGFELSSFLVMFMLGEQEKGMINISVFVMPLFVNRFPGAEGGFLFL